LNKNLQSSVDIVR